MSTMLRARLQKVEQAAVLILTAREWEAMTEPEKVERQFEEAAKRIPLCTTAEEVMVVLHSLPAFDPDVMDRCNTELLPLIPDALLLGCMDIQDRAVRRQEIRDKVKRALRKGPLR